jgi:PAS domain S-box-containing protein
LTTRRRAVSARSRPETKRKAAKRVGKTPRRPARPAAVSRLKLRARQHAAIAALGERALAGTPPFALMEEAVACLREALDVEYVKVCELMGEGPHFIVRAGSGWKPGTVGNPALAPEGDSQANYTLRAERPVIVADVARETRFATQPLLTMHDVVSGISVIIRRRGGPYGVLAAHSTRRRRFGDDDASVLTSAANIIGMVLDRDRADSQLRESESRLRAFFDNSPLLLDLRAPDGRYLMANRYYREVFGVSPKQLIGKTADSLYPAAYAAQSRDAILRVARSRRAEIDEREMPTPNGARTFVTTRFPILGGDGSVSAVGTIAPDVTALREAEAENRHYRDLLESVTETIPLALAYIDAGGVYQWINRRGAERLGHAREYIVGRSMRDLFGEQHWTESLGPQIRRVLAGEPVKYDQTVRRQDGTALQIETHFTPALGPDGRIEGVCMLAIDVTDRTRTTQALAHTVSTLQATFDSTADGILVVDHAGKVTAWNRQFAQLWRLPDALLQEGDDARLLAAACEQLLDPEVFLAKVRELYASPDADSFDMIEFKDGRIVERYSKAQKIDGKTVGRVWSFRDVTERQRARETLLQANDALELRVAERTSQLEAAHREAETLSYSIAHDLRAPLRAISGYARILMEDLAEQMPDDASPLLERIGVNAERMGTLIDALLGFGRLSRQPLQPVKVRLDDVVQDALGWMHAELEGRRVEIKRGKLGHVLADPALIRIAVTNLLSNAIKFSRGRDPAVVEIGRTSQGKETVYFVRDNGAGFDMRYAAKLFGMFQRLHGHTRFEGSGVGLASVQQIVHRHGGRIWAESSEGQGATFFFTLGG